MPENVRQRIRPQGVPAALAQVVLHPALEPPRIELAAWAWLGVLLALAGLAVLHRVTTSDPGLLPRGGARTNGLCAQVLAASAHGSAHGTACTCLLVAPCRCPGCSGFIVCGAPGHRLCSCRHQRRLRPGA